MKKIASLILLGILFFLGFRVSFSQAKIKKPYILQSQGTVSAKIPSGVILGNPKNVTIFKNGNIVWGEKDKALIFKKNKSKQRKVESFVSKGRGPGETLSAMYYLAFNSDKLAIFDRSQAKITVFDSTQSHLYDVPISNIHTNQFIVIEGDLFATFNNPVYRKETNAISIYNKKGKLINQVGDIPYYGILQAYRNGGGVTKDNKGNIYYSYLGGYKIWKINSKTGKSAVFSKKPEYFDGISHGQITSLHDNLKKLIRYSFKVSRVSNLFFMEPDLIIQQIDDGNPWEGEQVQTFLEIWNTNGKKLGQVKIPHWVAGVKGQRIYMYINTPSKLIQKSDHQSTIKLFDAFKLQKSSQ